MKISSFNKITDEVMELMLQHIQKAYSNLLIQESTETINDLLSAKLSKWMEGKLVSGAICTIEDKIVGFLFAELKLDGNKRQAWVPSFGIATTGCDPDRTLYELYRYASREWIAYGCFEHVIETLNNSAQIDSLHMLGFAFQQVYGLLKLSEYKPLSTTADVLIRKGAPDDVQILRRMADIIFSFQNGSPVYVPAQPELVREIRDGYAGVPTDDEALVYIAEQGEPVAFQGLWCETKGYMTPEGTVKLNIAGTFNEQSGSGIGKQLMNYVVEDCISMGYKWCSTDWRITNIRSRRFWTKCGFRVTKYRMIREIDPNVAWANFRNELLQNP